MTTTMQNELNDLAERAWHADTMRFTAEDAERLTYLEMVADLYRAEREALA